MSDELDADEDVEERQVEEVKIWRKKLRKVTKHLFANMSAMLIHCCSLFHVQY